LHIKDYKESNELSHTVSGDKKACLFAYIIGVTRAMKKCWDKRTTECSVELLSFMVSWFDLEVPKNILSETVLVTRAQH
jgi:hypothetical protein